MGGSSECCSSCIEEKTEITAKKNIDPGLKQSQLSTRTNTDSIFIERLPDFMDWQD